MPLEKAHTVWWVFLALPNLFTYLYIFLISFRALNREKKKKVKEMDLKGLMVGKQ